jgi:cold shock protein
LSVWVGVAVVTGRVVRFDELRGYGFVTPDTGGEDVFIHVNDLTFDKRFVAQGTLVEFDVEEGDRGLKASNVRLLDETTRPRPRQDGEDDDALCDVLSVGEFTTELTEALLRSSPTLTAEQIVHIRQHLIKLAHSHGWLEY